MKRLYSFLVFILLAMGVLAGCGNDQGKEEKANSEGKPKTEQSEEAAFPVTIKDAMDQEVTIDKKPEKIVSLIPSNTEIAFSLGLDKEIVGVSDFDNYPEAAKQKEKIGGMDFNVEKIISLKPDVVLAHASGAHNSKEGFQQLSDAGIKVIVVNDAQNFEQVYQSINMIGTATGEKENAEKVIAEMKAKFEEIKAEAAKISETDRKTAYIEVSPAPEIYTTGKNTFMDSMLQIINAKNAAGDQEGWVKIDQEAIIKTNPDVIITTYGPDSIKQIQTRKGWQEVNAVKNNQVVELNTDLVTRSGPRLAEGVEELAKAVYPDTFTK
ncbi:ABC transporter substrate-binding protein [Peribacillus cavernae]|uniref:ABC transporter substrate-binding protein n=1 Tax=Peribacillus cavernae TaxID=1674310 RepID=A0A3S0VNI5_9BACI|nr:ABC transporter substrate-binding protein [Peribacillus cavernae]MDQ0218597.1 iron complex transport system substrate-binding protein [Peribacillus cavernae]RUQ31582.1 ABC transporter substrate-binding protein [Peribacillus cavernae]